MATLQTIEHEGKLYDYMRFSSPAELLRYAQENYHAEMRSLVRNNGVDWAGLGLQSLADFEQEGYSSESLALFRKASAKLAYSPALGSQQTPTVAGGAWVMPLVLSNNPLPARNRLRNKLPPKNLLVRIGTHGGISAEALAAPVARIARAVWDYQSNGGITTLTLWQASRYDSQCEAKTARGTYGIRIDCVIPISSEAAISSALGIPFYRIAYLAIANSLAPRSTVFSFVTPSPANVIWLNGTEENDSAQLAKGLQ